MVSEPRSDTPECNVVIATRNRPEALKRCLAGLRNQTYRDFSVIVVDDASDVPIEDWLPSIWDGLTVSVTRLPVQSGPAEARNRGVALGQAEFVAFIDDDVMPHPRLLAAHREAIAAAETFAAGPVVSCGPFVEPADWKPTPWNLWEARQAKHEANCMIQGVYEPTWRQFHTGNNMLRRELFQRAGGFDTTFTRSEDDEFGLRLHRLGTRFHFEPSAIALHYSERSLGAWLAIPRAYAHFDAKIDATYPEEKYLAKKRTELAERNPVLRAVRAASGAVRARSLASRAAAHAARLAFRARLTPVSLALLSISYDLAYVDSLEAEIRQREQSRPALDPVRSTAD